MWNAACGPNKAILKENQLLGKETSSQYCQSLTLHYYHQEMKEARLICNMESLNPFAAGPI